MDNKITPIKKYYNANREAILKQKKEYYQKNKEKMKQQQRDRYELVRHSCVELNLTFEN